MGNVMKGIGKVLDVVKPFVSMINPALGMALGLAGDLMQGKNPLQSLLGAATSMIPGGGVMQNILGNFAGGSLLDGAGGNSLLSAGLNLATGQSKITDVLGGLMKSTSGAGGLSENGMANAAELAAQRMASLLA